MAGHQIEDWCSELRIKLWIVGRKIPDSIKKLGTDGVVFDEYAF